MFCRVCNREWRSMFPVVFCYFWMQPYNQVHISHVGIGLVFLCVVCFMTSFCCHISPDNLVIQRGLSVCSWQQILEVEPLHHILHASRLGGISGCSLSLILPTTTSCLPSWCMPAPPMAGTTMRLSRRPTRMARCLVLFLVNKSDFLCLVCQFGCSQLPRHSASVVDLSVKTGIQKSDRYFFFGTVVYLFFDKPKVIYRWGLGQNPQRVA